MSKLFSLLLALAVSAGAFADDKELDPSIGTIKKLDMTKEDAPGGPGFIVVMMDLKKLKVPGAHGHAIVRQFTKRSRIDFNGSGLPKGKYSLSFAASCTGAFKSSTELHTFQVSSAHVATEKSLPKYSLKDLEGKQLMLFHHVKGKIESVDCKTIAST